MSPATLVIFLCGVFVGALVTIVALSLAAAARTPQGRAGRPSTRDLNVPAKWTDER